MVFSAPKEWENWLSLGLGLWLLFAPVFFQNGGSEFAVENSLIVGFLIVVAEVFTFSPLGAIEQLIDFGLALWLVASPWALGISNFFVAANFVTVGFLMMALILYELWEERSKSME